MKRASETDEAGVLDEAFLHKGGELGWDLFGGSRLTPAEIGVFFGVIDSGGIVGEI